MQVNLKTLIIIISILLSVGVAKHYYDRSERNKLLKEINKKLENEKEIAAKRADSVKKERDNIINNLIQENEKAKADSQYWYTQAKKKSINPNYDINFHSAANIITGSKYKPSKANSNLK